MLKKLFFSGTVCLILSIHGYSQPGVPDTLTILSYNTLNYGFAADGSQPTLNTQSKHTWLRTILNYAHPDILGLVKMDASLSTFTTDTIVHKILDSVCAGCYHHALFTNYSGYTKENMLYFRDDKIGFLGTTTIYSGDPNISDINLHSLYYKTPDLSLTHDTIFLNIILVHIKSGSGNDNQRGAEINGVMNWLNSHITHPGNYFIMGDFNTQSSSEICYQSMVNSSNPDTKFNDPVNMHGDWANNPTFYANYLTQSSRVADLGDGGATGGLGLRFDQILCTQPVIDGSQRVKYIPNSYIVIGQDGLHTNVGLIDAPTNNSVPAPVLNALYYMSNHLPVSVKVSVVFFLQLTNTKVAIAKDAMIFVNFIIFLLSYLQMIFTKLIKKKRSAHKFITNLYQNNVLWKQSNLNGFIYLYFP